VQDPRHPSNDNAGLFEFGSELTPADLTTLSSHHADGAAAKKHYGIASCVSEADALAGFGSETSERRSRRTARPNLALLPAQAAAVDDIDVDVDVRRTGCSSDLETRARLSIADIRARILRRTMHIVGAVLIVAPALQLGVYALQWTTRELTPAAPVMSRPARPAFDVPASLGRSVMALEPLDGTIFFTPRPGGRARYFGGSTVRR
jgi:hypothetical protein